MPEPKNVSPNLEVDLKSITDPKSLKDKSGLS